MGADEKIEQDDDSMYGNENEDGAGDSVNVMLERIWKNRWRQSRKADLTSSNNSKYVFPEISGFCNAPTQPCPGTTISNARELKECYTIAELCTNIGRTTAS